MGLLADFQAYRKANTPRNTRKPVDVGTVFNQGLLNPNQYNAVAANRLKDSSLGLLGIVPGAGDYASGVQAADYYNRGENGNALLAGLGALPIIPNLAAAGATLGGLGVMAKVADKIGTPMITGPGRNQAGAIVYHGSPHKFDKFDMSKIGTGEGAQAYGHGLYFAESPDVAKSYQDLAKRAGPQVDGAQLNRMNASFEESALANMYQNRLAAGLPPDQAAAQTAKWGASHPQIGKDMADGFVQKLAPPPDGNLYKVDIPDEAIPRMLDWDKPLSEQANLHEQLRPVVESVYGAGSADYILGQSGATAKTMLDDSRRVLGDSGLAESAMRQAGIPGIRYLDGNSRGAGGTSNFVLFDDQLPRILETNGVPTGLLSYADEAAQKAKKAKK